jgi:hypothetical protein
VHDKREPGVSQVGAARFGGLDIAIVHRDQNPERIERLGLNGSKRFGYKPRASKSWNANQDAGCIHRSTPVTTTAI